MKTLTITGIIRYLNEQGYNRFTYKSSMDEREKADFTLVVYATYDTALGALCPNMLFLTNAADTHRPRNGISFESVKYIRVVKHRDGTATLSVICGYWDNVEKERRYTVTAEKADAPTLSRMIGV